MKLGTIRIFLLMLSFILSDCSLPLDIMLYNHTGKDLLVHVEKRTLLLNKDSSVMFKYPGTTRELQVSADSKIWKYEVMYPPKEFEDRQWMGLGGHEIHLQIEENGEIFMLKPNTKVPTLEYPPQPSGFPLVPKQS